MKAIWKGLCVCVCDSSQVHEPLSRSAAVQYLRIAVSSTCLGGVHVTHVPDAVADLVLRASPLPSAALIAFSISTRKSGLET